MTDSVDLYFITGNKNKFKEVQAVFPHIKMLNLDLPEIQSLDPHEIIRFKLLEALKHKKGQFIVEDTSLFLDGLNGLPGPLIKWFLEKLGDKGIWEIVSKTNSNKAQAKTLIGYANNKKEIFFFEGTLKGRIGEPIVKTSFGWDALFVPEGSSKSFAEMSQEEKNKTSMRRIALDKLKDHLDKKNKT